MNRGKRIALYGGTFDPVHLGHLKVAKRVSELFEIDEVLFVPAQIAPHKISREVTPPLHRYAMLALATQNEPGLRISTFELEAPDRRYTVDTLAHFKRELGGRTDLFFIMGADSWSEITSWHEWEQLLTMANHIVVTRPGYEMSAGHVTPVVAERIVDLRGLDESRATKTVLGFRDERIFITDAVVMDVSATDIRRAARESDDQLAKMVPAAVANYINKYGIYKD
jgi:nicotinate-nucleotide adenylyltransferase